MDYTKEPYSRGKAFGHHDVKDYDKALGEGQSCNDYVDQEFGRHGHKDYDKILGEGQDDYKDNEYMDLFYSQQKNQKQEHQRQEPRQRSSQMQKQQRQEPLQQSSQMQKHQEYPATHLYKHSESAAYPSMNEQQYQPETVESEIDNQGAHIPGCGQGSPEQPEAHRQYHHGPDFDPETMLQARKMNENVVPQGSVDTTCAQFERTHINPTPIPGAGQINPSAHHYKSFDLVSGDSNTATNPRSTVPRSEIRQQQQMTEQQYHQLQAQQDTERQTPRTTIGELRRSVNG